MKTLVLLFILKFSLLTYAFPEMVRHHYVNCAACHVANAGGGLLNAYGRTISYDVLSTWGTEKEARAFYSIDPEKTSEWLNVGGDVRSLQLHQDNSTSTRGRFFWMEANIQAAVAAGPVTAFLSLGQIKQANQSIDAKPTKYFISYQHSDELAVRAGRYVPIYGLNIPQHNYLIRQNLAFGPGAERDSADIQWNGEKINLVAGVSKSLADSAIREVENALNLQALYNLNDQHKVGVNYWYGEAQTYKKIIFGAQAVLGWTENLYTLTEIDHVWSKNTSTDVETKSLFQLLKIGYEFHKGMHFQFVEEYGKTDTTSTNEIQNLGLGAIWYPRPHFEIEFLWSKKAVLATSNTTEDYAYVLTHFYF